MKILIAEDDTTSSLLLRRSLEKLGHEVVVANDGRSAWHILSGGNGSTKADIPRLLITDWMMPEMDGIELTRRLRDRSVQDPDARSDYVYVMLLTAKCTPSDRVHAMEAGADDFLSKPLDQGDLVARLEVAKRVLALQDDRAKGVARVKTLQNRLQANRQPLGELLISAGVVTRDQLQHALNQQVRTGQPIGLLLIASGAATEEDITRARAVQLDVDYVDLKVETP